ncbi:MAG: hypothetical protein HYZ20_20220, partial [Burkholderiales bacterium]|nr:hypothetical protein [Burkholderiales bacterium]
MSSPINFVVYSYRSRPDPDKLFTTSYFDVFIPQTSPWWDYWGPAAQFTGVKNGTTSGGWFEGWCFDPFKSISSGTSYNWNVYSPYEPGLLPGGGYNAGNLDSINWLLNLDLSTTGRDINYGEVQSAIWNMLWGGALITTGSDITQRGPVSSADVTYLIGRSTSEGNGFVPDVEQGHIITALLYPSSGSSQPVLIEVPTAALGDFVWHDVDADGIQDAGEAGINGATVVLWRDLDNDGLYDGGSEKLAQTLTFNKDGQDGYYAFKGLLPGLEYQVLFETPAGFNAVSPRQAGGDPALDSDGPVSDPVILTAGEFDRTIDSGFYVRPENAALGDRVWEDKDADGVQDAGELGIAGVTVNLYDCITNALVGSTFTDIN